MCINTVFGSIETVLCQEQSSIYFQLNLTYHHFPSSSFLGEFEPGLLGRPSVVVIEISCSEQSRPEGENPGSAGKSVGAVEETGSAVTGNSKNTGGLIDNLGKSYWVLSERINIICCVHSALFISVLYQLRSH